MGFFPLREHVLFICNNFDREIRKPSRDLSVQVGGIVRHSSFHVRRILRMIKMYRNCANIRCVAVALHNYD